MKVNLGPVALGLTNGSSISNGDGLSYNPRCLKRDLTDYSNKRWANATSVVSLILDNKDVESFQMEMQGVPGSGSIGVHGGGKSLESFIARVRILKTIQATTPWVAIRAATYSFLPETHYSICTTV